MIRLMSLMAQANFAMQSLSHVYLAQESSKAHSIITKLYIVGKTVKKQVNVNITRYLSEFLALSLFLFGTSFLILALLA